MSHSLAVEQAQFRRNRFSFESAREMVLLAPSSTAVPGAFQRAKSDPDSYQRLLAEMQRLRGSIYLQEGAIQERDLTNGRHRAVADEHSWHILVLDSTRKVSGCVRFRQHSSDAKFSRLGVANSALARCETWGGRFRSTVTAEMALSKTLGVAYVEMGGWALSEELRGTTEGIRIALAAYGLGQALGGAVGITTATHRNGSAGILRRIGGLSFFSERQEIPAYFDPQFTCDMEVLRFYSWAPQPRFRSWVAELSSQIQNVRVISRDPVDEVPNPSGIPFEAKSWYEPKVSTVNSRLSVV